MATPDLHTELVKSYEGAMRLAGEQMRIARDKHPDTARVYNVVRALAYVQNAVGYADFASVIYDTGSPRYERWMERLHDAMRTAGWLEGQIEMAMTEADVHHDLCLGEPRHNYSAVMRL